MRVTALLTTVLALLLAPPLRAQSGTRLDITLPAADSRGKEAPLLRSPNVFDDRAMDDLLVNGFPARLHYRLELWSTSGWFDHLKDQIEWDVIVRYNALDHHFTASRIVGKTITPLGTFTELRAVEDAVGQPFQPPMRAPTGHDKYYYNAVLNIEMLSVNDLDEVERWLRGELRPAVQGKKSPGTAITRGAKTLVVRLLGGEERHYEVRSEMFRPDEKK
ncbi:MAG TPA: hypothetical protein VFJ96_10605 [Gemmatimonadaceae bacterium]|nr:hypothetical protein [Gemmatimonadaceae bacterium]